MIDMPPPEMDTEPVTAPYVQCEERDSTPNASVWDQWVADFEEHRVVEGNGTTCFMFYRPFLERHSWWSDTSLQSSSGQEVESVNLGNVAVDEAVDTRDKRLVLLARKYASKEFPDEDKARLEIVTMRLRKMFPRIEAADFEVLEKMAQDVEAAQEKRLAVRRKLGLDR